MGFLHPLALLGLAAATLPALLHLLQRRRPQTVVFPAVRYLTETEERHSRRLKLRNLLLLLLRTLLIVAVVLAAARPVVPAPVRGAHAPSALVVILDNSLSSAAVTGGRPVVDGLVAGARDVVGAATPGDALWLVLADGIPRAVGRDAALRLLDAVEPLPVRLDLGDAVRSAAGVLAGQSLPGAIVLLSDLQATAFSAGEQVGERIVALLPPPPARNRGVDSVRAEPATWSPGGRVLAAIGGVDGPEGEVQLVADGRVLARDLAAAGEQVALAVDALPPGWHAAAVRLAPDELRLDDTRWVAIRAAPPAAVTVAPGAGRFVAEAIGVLADGGRVRSGVQVILTDRPGPGRTVLFPPADAALVGAVNRALTARGIAVRFGDLLHGEWSLAGDVGAAGTAVYRRYRLVGDGRVIARAGDEPWLVRSGDYVIVASRLEEPWTGLPLAPAFVPFLDALVNRVAAAEAWRAEAAPGATAALPAGVASVLPSEGARPQPGGDRIAAPLMPGVYFLADAAGDTIGALTVNPDPRESDLRPATAPAARRSLGRRAELVARDALVRRAFAAGGRTEIATLLLALALVLAVVELVVASAGSGRLRRER